MTRPLTPPPSQVSSASPSSLPVHHSPRTTSSTGPPSTAVGHQRHNGFERPFSRDQLISWIGHSVSAVCFFLGALSLCLCCTGQGNGPDNTDTSRRRNSCKSMLTVTVVAVAVHIVNSTVLVASWRVCETIDPAIHADPSTSWWSSRLSGPRWAKTRYCAVCRKTVPGMDHHCTWLQTCIGRANYVQFFTVACTGTVQFGLQVAYAVACLWWLYAHPMMPDAAVFGYVAKASCILCAVLSLPCMFMYVVLVGFHLWLMVLGYGTYEWMLRRRQEQRAKVEARKMAQQAARDNATRAPRSSSRTRPVVTIDARSTHAGITVTDVRCQERERELTTL
ncbi:unnamed protein product [Hyaloperonospora brassicae]|uniref:Palmitoyltransferase n=1 Tax=Hyaloperonospora brassicae TaxID=162125 RepID=A0AAV0V4D8_HYABA|nr:unnamed protein product [Hyaloperonospora brassicae]